MISIITVWGNCIKNMYFHKNLFLQTITVRKDGYRMIYCVEDEKNIRELLIYTLETTGFSAKGMANAKELRTA